MFSWITGARGAQNEDPDATSIEPPETPAPVFAVRAFKQVLFGTPQPFTPNESSKSAGPNASSDIRAGGAIPRLILQPSEKQIRNEQQQSSHSRDDGTSEAQNSSSPSKPPGILLTPGTATSRRKQVNFAEHVVDNEGKSTKYSRSGLPDNYPGKFPSPWTPKTTTPVAPVPRQSEFVQPQLQGRAENMFEDIPTSNKTLQNPLAQKLPVHTQPDPSSASRAKDDADITLDLTLPRSTSGRFWKEQYDNYSKRSEAETKRLITKHKIAKDFARMKDDEVMSLRTQLDTEFRRRQRREKSLESQVKDMRERLREALAENAKLCAEITGLRVEIQNLSRTSTDAAASLHSPVQANRSFLSKRGASEIAGDLISKEKTSAGKLENSAPQRPRSKLLSPGEKSEINSSDLWLDNEVDAESDHPTRRRLARRSGKAELKERRTKGTDSLPRTPPSRRGVNTKVVRIPLPSPLSNRSPNLPSNRQSPTPTDLNNVKFRTFSFGSPEPPKETSTPSPLVTRASLIQVFDEAAPLQALDMQARQPITPHSSSRNQASNPGRTPRSSSGRKVEAKRLDEAKARIAARRKSKLEKKIG